MFDPLNCLTKNTETFNNPYRYTSLLFNQMRGYEDTFMAQGISSLNWENAHLGQLPNRVPMIVVDNDAYA